MYLLVIVTLIIGVLSLYAQILSLQAARFAASQTVFATTMLQWHGAAVTLAASIGHNGVVSAPCSLTIVTPPSLSTVCPQPPSASAGTVTSSSPTYQATTISGASILPPGYASSIYQFYSVMYPDNGQYFVVTYVTPPIPSTSNPAPGYLSLPPNTSNLIGVTSNDLQHQLSISGVPDYAYGTAKSSSGSSILLSPSLNGGETKFQYDLPMNGAAPILTTGSIAVVSSTAGY